MENKYQEALDRVKEIYYDCDGFYGFESVKKCDCSLNETCFRREKNIKLLQELVDKETPKKFEIIDRELIFHSTPNPTEYYLTIKCYCGQKFGCRGYQHWKVIDKHNVAKDCFEYEYSYCPHCGRKIEESDKYGK